MNGQSRMERKLSRSSQCWQQLGGDNWKIWHKTQYSEIYIEAERTILILWLRFIIFPVFFQFYILGWPPVFFSSVWFGSQICNRHRIGNFFAILYLQPRQWIISGDNVETALSKRVD